MAGTIPSYPQLRASKAESSTPIEWQLSENGKQLGVDLGDQRWYRWEIVYLITQTEFDALITLYEANQSVSGSGPGQVSFTDDRDSSAHTAEFLARPSGVWRAPDQIETLVVLLEVP